MAARQLLPIALPWMLACSDADVSPPAVSAACEAGLEEFRGACVDPATRYEPAVALDADNVSSFGPLPQTLDLPPPPRSGFPPGAPPRRMEAAAMDASFGCSAVVYPIPEITRKLILRGPRLHHAGPAPLQRHRQAGERRAR